MQLFYKNLDEAFQISFLDFKVAKPLFSITVVLTNIWRKKKTIKTELFTVSS